MNEAEKFIETEAARLRGGSPKQLLDQAAALGIQYDPDTIRIASLADACAAKLWEMRGGGTYDAEEDMGARFGSMVATDWSGNEVLKRFIGAIGGLDWLMGPTPQAERARQHVKALDAVLAGLALEAEAKRPGEQAPFVYPPNVEHPVGVTMVDAMPRAGVSTAAEALYGPNPGAHVLVTPNDEIGSKSASFILDQIVPKALTHFLSKNADYGDQHRTGLGIRAEYVGLHRKMAKLESAIWLGKLMNHEGPEEMLEDIFGQVLLMLDLLAWEPEE